MAARRVCARRRQRRLVTALAAAAAIVGTFSVAGAVEIRAESKEDKLVTENTEENGWPHARVRGISKDPVIMPLMMEQPSSADIILGLTKLF